MRTVGTILFAVSVMAGVVGGWIHLTVDEGALAPIPADEVQTQGSAGSQATGGPSPLAKSDPLSALSPALQEYGLYLRQQFGSNIRNAYWQINLIDTLIRKFKKQYPNDWEERVRELIRAAFPELADVILAKFAAYQDYTQWSENLKTMHFESKEERLQAAWDKRRELFGADADVIWAKSIKQQKIVDTLGSLNTSTEPLPDKVDTYVSSLVEAFGPEVLDVTKVNTTELMSNFLQLESVQEDMRKLPPEEQRASLRQFRAAMGLDQEALKRWDDLDTVRADRRSNGDRYTQTRAQLEQQFSGEALNNKLDALRKETFGEEEAQYIRNEEAAGYYRYEQPQVIGVD